MLDSQAIYGPHACRQWDGGDISMGQRLFRLLPEDTYDRQPLIGGGGRFALVADIRLDNRPELERTLDISQDRARQTSDAAILMAAWETWAERCFDRLTGCFAFALWDEAKQTLVLARDPLGQRPLHLFRGEGFWAFASMPKGLHVLEEAPRAANEAAATNFLALMPEHGSETFFAGIERVEPGCYLTVTSAGARSTRHWRPIGAPIRYATDAEYAEAAREKLDQAVSAQLRRAEGGLGAQLSGGYDSSGVTATAARLLFPTGERITAFTSAPREGYFSPWKGLWDESSLAAATAAMHENIDHVVVRPPGKSPVDSLDRDHFLFDRPVLNLCNLEWNHEINRQARDRGISVILTGLMANHSLSYMGIDLLSEYLAQGRLRSWLRLARAVVGARTRRWRGAVYHSIGPWIPGSLWHRLERARGRYGGGVDVYTALNPGRLAGLDYARRMMAMDLDPYFRPVADTVAHRLACLRSVDLGNYNKGFLGGWGVDHRAPTMDTRLIEFCLNIPTEQFIADGRSRSLARRVLADRVPEIVLAETRTGYQAADWHEAVTAGRDDIAGWIGRLEGCGPAASALDLPRLRRLVENWPTSGWERDDVCYPYRFALLRGLSVGHFLHRASGSNQ
jgi:asparagine synthase (glutamine-hydrolysing)